METTDLLRETFDAERLAERNRLVLTQLKQLAALDGENKRLRTENEMLQAEISALKATQEPANEH